MASVGEAKQSEQDITGDLARANISRVPYLPGLDGLRALAVIVVMIYHANSSWLPGGFLGVEVFFVISGYLITLLLIAEQEREYHISLTGFWLRRARRLLPALFTLLALVTVWTALFERAALGALRGDVIAGLTYVSNWYQTWVGLGYTASGDFAPLRHLWSLAVEEQFYLIWPMVMIGLLALRGTRRIAGLAVWLALAALAVNVFVAVAYHPGVIVDPATTPGAYWEIAGRQVSKVDALYLSTVSRSGGLLLGAALAMAWRPMAVMRGPLRTAGGVFDAMAVAAMVVLAWMCWNVFIIADDGAADSTLFRGGLFAVGVLTVAVIAAVTHQGARANAVLGRPVLRWIGVRSYGLYLYHWPVYQAIRGVAGNKLSMFEFVFALAVTVAITEASFRYIETPIRKYGWRSVVRWPTSTRRRTLPLVASAIAAAVLAVYGGVALATAENRPNEIAADLAAGEEFTTDLREIAADQGVPAVRADGAADVDAPLAQTNAESPRAAGSTRSATTPPASGRAGTSASPSSLPASTPTPITATQGNATRVTTAPATTAAAPTTVATTAPPATTDPATTSPATTTTVTTSTVPGDDVVVPATTVAPNVDGPFQLGIVDEMSEIALLPVVPTTGLAPLVALGDSVMLGAADELGAIGFTVDARKSRQLGDFVPTMRALRDDNVFGSVVLFHLGTNGSVKDRDLAAAMDALSDVPVVLVLTGKANRGWIDGNNELIRALPATYPNVTVLDWERLATSCEGTCFYEDRIHLAPAGQRFYTSLIAQTLGL